MFRRQGLSVSFGTSASTVDAEQTDERRSVVNVIKLFCDVTLLLRLKLGVNVGTAFFDKIGFHYKTIYR